jgi:hypothetical protein
MAPTSSGQQLPANSKPVDGKVKALWEDTTEGYKAAAPRRTHRMPPAFLQHMSGMHACTLASRAVGPRPHQQGIKARRLQLLPEDLPPGFLADTAGGGGGRVDSGGTQQPGAEQQPGAGSSQQAGAAAASLPPPPKATYYVKDPGSCTKRGSSGRRRTSKVTGDGSHAGGGGRSAGSSGAAEQQLEVQLPAECEVSAGDTSSEGSSLPSPVDAEPAGAGDQQPATLDSIYPSGWSSLPDSSSPSSLGANSSPRSLV